MIIHVVEQGETINSIAERYGVSAERLALENGVKPKVKMVVGETIVVLKPEIVYTVREGDSLESIAAGFNISIMELLRNNPYLSEREYIFPYEQLVIKYEGDKIGPISTNGYVYPFIDMNLLKKTLPFLTYLSIYSHYYTATGEVISINDADIISTARDYGVAPIMVLTSIASRPEKQLEILHNILIYENLQNYLIDNILSILETKNYYGASFTTPYIEPDDRELYVQFIRKLSSRLRDRGYSPFITLTRSAFELLTNVDYMDLQYDVLGQLVDYVSIMTYEWGFSYGLPPSIVSFATFGNTILFALSQIESKKLNLGYSTIGYVWKLPYIEGVTTAQAITFNSAINLAREVNAEIFFDEVTKASYFQYNTDAEYILRFRDARGINDIVHMVPAFGVDGVVIWNVMYFFNQMWLVINSQFEIRRLEGVRTIERLE